MRRIVILTAASLLLCSSANAEEGHLPRIAVLDLTSRDVPESELMLLTERLRVSLFQTGQFQVLEREKVEDILHEQEFQVSPCAATECAIEIGRLVGADKMVAGSVGKIGSQYSLIIRLINVETGAIERTAVRDCRCLLEDVMTQTVGEAAGELAGQHAAPAQPGTEPQPERLMPAVFDTTEAVRPQPHVVTAPKDQDDPVVLLLAFLVPIAVCVVAGLLITHYITH